MYLNSTYYQSSMGDASLIAQLVKDLPTMPETGFNSWFGKIPWRRKWQPTPVFLPEESHGQRSPVGYSPKGRKELNITKVTRTWTYITQYVWTSLVAQTVKHLPTKLETRVQSLGWEDLLEKEMETHSNILAWKIPWTEEPGRLQSMGLQSPTWLSDFASRELQKNTVQCLSKWLILLNAAVVL